MYVFLFKQKTADEMRISDWRSDVCSSDLVAASPSDLQTKSADGKEKVPATEVSLPDWPNLEWAKQWAAIDPPLAENDLRPYVFVTRDRRSVFGAVTSLGELDELVAKLQGSPLQVKQAAVERSEEHTSELKSLMRNSYAVFCLTKKKK